MKIAQELADVLAVMVNGLYIVVTENNGDTIVSLLKRGKLSYIKVTDKHIFYGDMVKSITNAGILDIENAVISDFRRVFKN